MFFRKSDVTLIQLEIAIYNNIFLCENGVQKFISLSLSAVYSPCADFHLYLLDKQDLSELSRSMSDFSVSKNLLLVFIDIIPYNGHAHTHTHNTAIAEHKRQRGNLKSIQREKTSFSKE